MKRSTLAIAAAGLEAAGAFGWLAVRPWYRHWGATPAEIDRPMPLDGRIANPKLNTTMAIAIGAPPEEIWPWLAQIGDPPRAGYYSYTWIEKLAGLDIVNAGRLLPEHQQLHVGQTLDKNGTMTVLAVDPGRFLALGPPESIDYLKCVWSFELRPIGSQRTRLVTRVRAEWSWKRLAEATSPLTLPMWFLIEPGAFIMERKMLREIKRLAERSRPPVSLEMARARMRELAKGGAA